MKDKRGVFLGTTQSLIVASLFVIILIIVFVVFMNIAIKKDFFGEMFGKDVEKVLLKESSLDSLIAYLNTPVSVLVNGNIQRMTIAELIMVAKIDSSYLGKLESETKNVFDKIYADKYKLEIPSLLYVYEDRSGEYSFSEAELPDGGKVRLFLKK